MAQHKEDSTEKVRFDKTSFEHQDFMKTDFLIVGGGVIGLNIARILSSKYPKFKIQLIEKETGMGLHASTRNSGVLHAGFYYGAGSLKAKFCRNGNIAMTKYFETHGLPIKYTGKLVVA